MINDMSRNQTRRCCNVVLGGLVVLLLNLAVFTSSIYAQSTGKITGKITDAETKEALPGVSIFLEELPTVGASTDADGNYVILGVPPGKYNVVMSFVGFAKLTKSDVEVFSGRTTPLDGKMRMEVFEGEEIVVKADRPLVVKDRTSTVSYVTKESIENMPVQEVGDLIRVQPGVVQSDGGFNFQGGRTRETAYLIDGVPVQNVFAQGGGNSVDLEVQSVQEMQVFTGTFDAEFGGAQSGVVSVTTIDPSQKLTGNIRLQGGGYLIGDDDIFIGGDSYDPFESKDLAITLNGPIANKIGFFVNARIEDNVGYLKGQRRFTSEDGFNIEVYKRWFKDSYSLGDTRLIRLDSARTPNGAVITDSQGNPVQLENGDGEIVDMSWNKSYTFNPKLVFKPSGKTKISINAIYNYDKSQGYSNASRYAPDNRSTYRGQSLTTIAALRQTFGSDKFLNLRVSYMNKNNKSYAFDSINDSRIQYFSSSDDVTGFNLGSTSNGESESKDRQLIISGDFTWQVNASNELKTGFQFRRNQRIVYDKDRSWVYADDQSRLFENFPYPSIDAYPYFDQYLAEVKNRVPVLVPELESIKVDNYFNQAPIEFAYFIQDKLEFNDNLVVKGGLRFEYFDVGEKHIIDPRTPTDRIGEASNFKKTDPKMYVSPRVGISFPFSQNGAFRVAYGHFIQMTAYQEMLKNPIFEDINIGLLEGLDVGNPNLDAEKTIKYEIGLQQQLSDKIGIDVQFFYKNTKNLLGRENLATLDNVQYSRRENRDFGIIKGGTVAMVTKPMGFLLNSFFDVTYSDARGSSSSAEDLANIVIAGRSGELGEMQVERRLSPLDWDQTLTFNAGATVGKPNDWSLSLIGQLASGQPYTPTFLDPSKDFPDSEYLNLAAKPMLIRLDLNAKKEFKVGKLKYGVKLQVNNLFNYLNENAVNTISGRADQIIRLASVQADRVNVMDYVGLFTPEEDDNYPNWYSAPRQVLIALTLNF